MVNLITLVYHHGGRLERNANGVVVYNGGEVTEFSKVIAENLSYYLLEGLYKSIGYRFVKDCYWAEGELGVEPVALHLVKVDSDVIRLYGHVISNGPRVHLYCEHVVDVAEEVDVVDADVEEGILKSPKYIPPQCPVFVNPPTTLLTPNRRIKMRARRTPIPTKKIDGNNFTKPTMRTAQNQKPMTQLPKANSAHSNPKSNNKPHDQSQHKSHIQLQTHSNHNPQPQPQTQIETQTQHRVISQSGLVEGPNAQPHDQAQKEVPTQQSINKQKNRRASYKRPAPIGKTFVQRRKNEPPKIYVPRVQTKDSDSKLENDSDRDYH
ncbi:hypothetical protein PIB30_044641 [Stylosanthes scabra]|uniref:PB1-like domain-containing protein n=1 Tax=Stylosanthes scabra TaxID=79078 RepID=A0ABU6WJB9_9FABA|nr:hypothetical protein [Stylosanthes scabra]